MDRIRYLVLLTTMKSTITICFEDVEQAEVFADKLEDECKAIRFALDNKMFDDAYTEKAMLRELQSNEEQLDELWPLILSMKYPLL